MERLEFEIYLPYLLTIVLFFLDLELVPIRFDNKKFKFETTWLHDSECHKVVKHAWGNRGVWSFNRKLHVVERSFGGGAVSTLKGLEIALTNYVRNWT